MPPFNVCPSCVRLNLPDARICTTCGAALDGTAPLAEEEHSEAFVNLAEMELDADTTPSVHLDAPESHGWFNSRSGGSDVYREPIHPTQTGDPDAPPSPVARAAAKLRRRAQVRRKLLAHQGRSAATDATADALVLEGDDPAREQLCVLLEAFGFRMYSAQNTAQAVHMLAARRYTVAFLSLVFDGSAAPASHDLCSRVKARPTHAGDTVCALVIVAGAARPVERVRAELAGCDAFLLKPVSRGAVAQALEACGVALPIDSRRA